MQRSGWSLSKQEGPRCIHSITTRVVFSPLQPCSPLSQHQVQRGLDWTACYTFGHTPSCSTIFPRGADETGVRLARSQTSSSSTRSARLKHSYTHTHSTSTLAAHPTRPLSSRCVRCRPSPASSPRTTAVQSFAPSAVRWGLSCSEDTLKNHRNIVNTSRISPALTFARTPHSLPHQSNAPKFPHTLFPSTCSPVSFTPFFSACSDSPSPSDPPPLPLSRDSTHPPSSGSGSPRLRRPVARSPPLGSRNSTPSDRRVMRGSSRRRASPKTRDDESSLRPPPPRQNPLPRPPPPNQSPQRPTPP